MVGVTVCGQLLKICIVRKIFSEEVALQAESWKISQLVKDLTEEHSRRREQLGLRPQAGRSSVSSHEIEEKPTKVSRRAGTQ